jgi:catechol-2,3-dioxygenase
VIAKVVEIAFFTDDVARLAAFYEQLLGRAPDSRSEASASFDLGGTTLFIHVAGGEAPGGAPNADHIAFALDQDQAAERARAAEVDVIGPDDFYWGRSAYVRDPDGRVIELQAEE